jgi:hypothetical protein
VGETVALNETELSEYCRRQGLYPQQIEAWRASCRPPRRTHEQQRAANADYNKPIRRVECGENKTPRPAGGLRPFRVDYGRSPDFRDRQQSV